ncbi:MAG: hypothetical protein R2764_15105 [Bacteroidales bacterium]
MNKGYLLIFILGLFTFIASGQTAELKINKKHSIDIQLTTSLGLTDIPDGYYEFNDSLYFTIAAKGDWELSKGDSKDFQSIQIKQSDIPTLASRTHTMLDNSKKISKLLIVYPKKKIDITKPFEFTYEVEYISNAIAIPEKHWPYYIEFNGYYNDSKKLKDEMKYIEAFKKLQNILPGNENYNYYIKFSNYNLAKDNLFPEIINGYLDSRENQLLGIKNLFSGLENIPGSKLAELEVKKDSVILIMEVFDPYYRNTESINIDLRNNHQKLIDDYTVFYNNSYDQWKIAVLGVIETGYYKNENKYEIFIELLTRLLIYTDHVSLLSAFDSINVSLISDPTKEVAFFKKHIDILNEMEWKEEFVTVLMLLNQEIKANTRLVGEKHLLNLKTNMKYESQPNYNIIYAFNELVKGNFETFKDNIQLAISKCTDKRILYYLELWQFSFKFRNLKIEDSYLEKVNSGLDFEQKYLPKDAITQYEMAKRMRSNIALPSFLMGRIKLDWEKEVFVAERYLNDAINIYPGFALARIYNLEIQIQNELYDNALNEIEAMLNISSLSIWYIYYLKAKILSLKGKQKEALEVINNNCLPFNENNFDQYILLGDIYFALKDCENAKLNYQNAGDIDVSNEIYSTKMKELLKECN